MEVEFAYYKVRLSTSAPHQIGKSTSIVLNQNRQAHVILSLIVSTIGSYVEWIGISQLLSGEVITRIGFVVYGCS